jgi:RES domain-containing protein
MRGTAFRHQAPGFDPLDGGGARINGGRYNPPESFPCLYLCLSMDCAVAEFNRLGMKHPAGKAAFLPRELYEYRFEFQNALDLTSDTVLDELSLGAADLIVDRWDFCQSIGQAAHAVGFQAIRAPSATGVGQVLCVFPENLGGGTLIPRPLMVWEERNGEVST